MILSRQLNRLFLKKQTSRYRPACQFLTQSAELIHIDIQHVNDFFQQMQENHPSLIILAQSNVIIWLKVLQHKWRNQQI